MMKVYTTRPYRVLLNLVYGAAAAAVACLFAHWLLDNLLWSVAIGGAIFLLYLWLVILDNRITLAVDDQWLTVTKGKTIQRFAIDSHGFRARTVSSDGDTECHLYIIDAEGKEEHVDCELIGVGQFRQLLDDLGITGSKAQATKIETKRS